MLIKLKNIYFILILISALSLAVAHFTEYVLNYHPCPLCVYQRFPYLILIVFSIIALSDQESHNYNKYIILTIIGSIAIAGYHSGIEGGVFKLSNVCKAFVTIKENLSISDFKKMLYSDVGDTPMCNKPTPFFLGLTMANWNLLLNVGLLIVFIFYIKFGRKTDA